MTVSASSPLYLGVNIDHVATLRQAQVVMEDMEIRRADLEDVFLQVMKGAA